MTMYEIPVQGRKFLPPYTGFVSLIHYAAQDKTARRNHSRYPLYRVQGTWYNSPIARVAPGVGKRTQGNRKGTPLPCHNACCTRLTG